MKAPLELRIADCGLRIERWNVTTNNMIAQVESLPELIRTEIDTLDERVLQLLDDPAVRGVQHLITTGCGDSHMAAVATELAFEMLAGLPTQPMTAMQAARYGILHQPQETLAQLLVVGISVSGTVARTQEAVLIAREAGAQTLALTANPQAPLGQVAEKVLDCSIPPFPDAPGVRTYRASLMALYLLAVRLAEARGRLTQDEARVWRERLRATADVIEATLAVIHERTRQLAQAVAEEKNFVFTGDGPNYGTALFGAAKVIEAAGRHAIGQDTEEWAHLQYFVHVDPQTPTFVISPGGRGHNRAAELMEPMQRVGRTVVAVVPDDDDAILPAADWGLPVVGQVGEMYSPMVYAVAGELFAAHLADVVGESFFRGFAGIYSEEVGNTIRSSRVISSAELRAKLGG